MDQNVFKSRTRQINNLPSRQGPVIYWMSRDQRVHDNYALYFAQKLAIQLKQPLLTVFNLVPQFLGSTYRQYDFMLKGLSQVEMNLQELNIQFHLLYGEAVFNILKLAEKIEAGALITDFDPLRIKNQWRTSLTEKITIPLWEVDTHNIVPCWITSDKQEYAARTIRPKINKLLDKYLVEIPQLIMHPFPFKKPLKPLDWEQVKSNLLFNSEVAPVSWLEPGENAAIKTLHKFIDDKLGQYAEKSNDPLSNCESNLSPYLHFGQISAQRVALEIMNNSEPDDNQEAFLEQLIVRKELSDNFCYYNNSYDSIECFPEWAKKTLNEHLLDPREFLYTIEQYENADTHDDLWNACQKEMVIRGKMPNYLRMYWAKKILEWTEHPAQAMEIAIYLNDKYQLDGRDPNGYTGIAWSIGGIHDRAWTERPVFGKIRYMNYNGCKRKFDVKAYIKKVSSLV